MSAPSVGGLHGDVDPPAGERNAEPRPLTSMPEAAGTSADHRRDLLQSPTWPVSRRPSSGRPDQRKRAGWVSSPSRRLGGRRDVRGRRGVLLDGGRARVAELITRSGKYRSLSASPHARTLMIVFPLRRSVELSAETASSRVTTLPMFVR